MPGGLSQNLTPFLHCGDRAGAMPPCRPCRRAPTLHLLPLLVEDAPRRPADPFHHLPRTLSLSLPLASLFPAAAGAELAAVVRLLPARIDNHSALRRVPLPLHAESIELGWLQSPTASSTWPHRPHSAEHRTSPSALSSVAEPSQTNCW